MRMYLDDIREPSEEFDIIVRSYAEAVHFVRSNKSIPNFISFDHDLGNDVLSGHDFAKWLVQVDLDKLFIFPEDFDFNVHSANPVGKENIEGLLNCYLKNKRG